MPLRASSSASPEKRAYFEDTAVMSAIQFAHLPSQVGPDRLPEAVQLNDWVYFHHRHRLTRDRQEYRRKSRGLEKRRRGRPRKYPVPQPLPLAPETIKDSKNRLFLLS